MSRDIPIIFNSPDAREEFWRALRCCWNCFDDEMRGRGYDIEFYEEYDEYDE